jgi:hypothetical protein
VITTPRKFLYRKTGDFPVSFGNFRCWNPFYHAGVSVITLIAWFYQAISLAFHGFRSIYCFPFIVRHLSHSLCNKYYLSYCKVMMEVDFRIVRESLNH